jgi:hypothetical protein
MKPCRSFACAAATFLALDARGKGAHLNCICIRCARARRVYILSACLHGRCARRDTTPDFFLPRFQRELLFFCAYFKSQIRVAAAALRNLLAATQNVCTMESEWDAFLLDKKAVCCCWRESTNPALAYSAANWISHMPLLSPFMPCLFVILCWCRRQYASPLIK